MNDDIVSVCLRRSSTATPWGFNMQGGIDLGSCLYIQKVKPNGIAYKAGVRPGDAILQICRCPAQYLSHQNAKMEIIRSGNELDLVLQRNVVTQGVVSLQEARSSVEEEPSPFRGYQNPTLQSRSFKIIQKCLNYEDSYED
ncbi:hypothetical protein SNE40_018558 [Patella caerulea]|uniref:PDZ domain-containing protein n=1 Tax=Patella caerulea TaxID=87958 RepID=A0AAN8J599_PATCE